MVGISYVAINLFPVSTWEAIENCLILAGASIEFTWIRLIKRLVMDAEVPEFQCGQIGQLEGTWGLKIPWQSRARDMERHTSTKSTMRKLYYSKT